MSEKLGAPIVAIQNAVKRYGGVTAVDDVSLEICAGEFFALLGPSGCGKTTLMRLVAGFEAPDAGRILIDGEDVSALPPHRRPVNMMFQSYALFPHMSVEGNIAFPLKRQGMAAGAIAQRVRDMLRLVQLDGLGSRRPDQLSGGQKARVALARALAARPRLLLLDEPLSALDRKLREETQFELMQVQRDLKLSFLVVTHDQDEAMAMAQRIAVMRAGRIEQVGRAREVYEQPRTAWVASFIGDANLLDAIVSNADAVTARAVLSAAGRPLIAAADAPAPAGAAVRVAVRAERIALSAARPQADNVVEGEIVDTAYLGDVTTFRVATNIGTTIKVARLSASGEVLDRGQRVFASWPADAARVLTQ